MDDFAAAPGVPNAFGLLGTEANSVAPGKRPLSSMSPTIVLKDNKPILAVGAAGGPTIITQTLLALIHTLDYGLPVVSSSDTAETARFISISARRESKMIEQLSKGALERLEATVHPDHIMENSERDAMNAADAVINGDEEMQIPVLDGTLAPLAEERNRKAKGITRSMLEEVPGIGPALASRIVERWPTMAALTKATEDEIKTVPGLSIQLSQRIVQILNG